MVNTFIILCGTKKASYRATARLLDYPRLNKQILEAYQLISVIEDASVISRKLGIPVPEQCKNNTTKKNMLRFLENIDWIKKVYKLYKEFPLFLVYQNKKYSWRESIPTRINSGKKYEVIGDKVHYTGKVYERKDCCFTFEGERVSTKNNTFVFHACIKMWAGYLNSLKYYFNCCLAETFRRGRNYSKSPYEIEGVPNKPWWVEYSQPMMASLLRKELINNEPVWYDRIFGYIRNTEWFDRGYVWYGNLTIDEIMDILSKEKLDPKYCAEKQVYVVPKKRQKMVGLIKADQWVDVTF